MSGLENLDRIDLPGMDPFIFSRPEKDSKLSEFKKVTSSPSISQRLYKGMGWGILTLAGAYGSKLAYSNWLSPTRATHNFDSSLRSIDPQECDSAMMKIQTAFLNLFEDAGDGFSGAMRAFVEDRNLKGLECLLDGVGKKASRKTLNGLLKLVLLRSDRPKSLEFIRALIERGAKKNLEYIPTVEELLKASGKHYLPQNANLFKEEIHQKFFSPLSAAVRAKDTDFIQYLMDKGVSPNIKVQSEGIFLTSRDLTLIDHIFEQINADKNKISCPKAVEMLKALLSSRKCECISKHCKGAYNSCKKLTYFFMRKISCWQESSEAKAFNKKARPEPSRQSRSNSEQKSRQQKARRDPFEDIFKDFNTNFNFEQRRKENHDWFERRKKAYDEWFKEFNSKFDDDWFKGFKSNFDDDFFKNFKNQGDGHSGRSNNQGRSSRSSNVDEESKFRKDIGVGASATLKEVKKKCRELMLKYHVDKTGANFDPDKWQKVVNACEYLRESLKPKA